MLACLAVLLPTAATSVRVCMLEQRILIAEVGADSNCCDGCTRETGEPAPCCVDLESLPDSSAPEPMVSLPAAVLSDVWLFVGG